MLLTLYKTTDEPRYLEYAIQMADFLLNDAERFADGVLQHTVNGGKDAFPQQAWVDTMFMAGGYKGVPYKRVQGWGQGLVLAFLSLLLKRHKRN